MEASELQKAVEIIKDRLKVLMVTGQIDQIIYNLLVEPITPKKKEFDGNAAIESITKILTDQMDISPNAL